MPKCLGRSPRRAFLVLALLACPRAFPQAPSPFAWPGGARAALSLSFDDARSSQVEVGTALLDRHGAKVTFFTVPGSVEPRLPGWKKALAAVDDIGNHSAGPAFTGHVL